MREVEVAEEEVGFGVLVFAAAVADEEGAGFDIVGLELVFCFVEDHWYLWLWIPSQFRMPWPFGLPFM